jgi:hypothetical protein
MVICLFDRKTAQMSTSAAHDKNVVSALSSSPMVICLFDREISYTNDKNSNTTLDMTAAYFITLTLLHEISIHGARVTNLGLAC